jgi:hypothetical protein
MTMLPSISAPIEAALVGDNADLSVLPTGVFITPKATPGSTFEPLSTGLRADGTADVNGAIATTLSPDGKTLLVLTSGYNKNFSTEAGDPIEYSVLDPPLVSPLIPQLRMLSGFLFTTLAVANWLNNSN